VERGLEGPAGGHEARSTLLDSWLADPDPDQLETMVVEAEAAGRWDALERIWILLAERTEGVSASTLRVFASVPPEARRAHPILTWASGAAASLLTEPPVEGLGTLWNRLLADSATLHADWSLRESTDEAVIAGTFRMIGERRLPNAQAGQALDAAWRTKEAIDQLLDERSRVGAGASWLAQAVFRAFSARLALFRGNPQAAVAEARWSTVLSDWAPLTSLARGIEALSAAIAREDGPEHFSEPPVSRLCDGLGARGLRGMGEVYEVLADGYEALRRLDRDGVDRSLSLVSTEAATITGVWAVRLSLEAWRTALWGDVFSGVTAVSSEIARLSVEAREAAEPMGSSLLRRAHAFLLAKSGAFTSATELASRLPEPMQLVVTARIHLWAGQYGQATWISDLGPHKPGLEIVQRYRLALIRVAAAVLEGSLTPDLRRDAVREVARLVRSRSFLYIALLPRAARDALLKLADEQLVDDADELALLRLRLSHLNDRDQFARRPLHLTDREQVLLPLLATSAPVPVIARHLTVSPNTVRKQVVTLREKFGASTRAELIRRARTAGVLE
jgi:DNA-binding NarL/FixJ family response regulator